MEGKLKKIGNGTYCNESNSLPIKVSNNDVAFDFQKGQAFTVVESKILFDMIEFKFEFNNGIVLMFD